MDQVNLNAWEGRTGHSAGEISTTLATQLHATLGNPRIAAPSFGDPVPQLWHWCAFPPLTPTTELGRDGHPGLGHFLPPVQLERRMWAGGALRFRAPIRVGEPLERRSSVRAIKEKVGKSGPMIFVTIDHAIYGASGLAIEEQQDIAYLPIPSTYTPPVKRPMPEKPILSAKKAMPETLLFRYSALTFNAHRIHYDLPYAKDVEHYPGLVVHGPLQATLLLNAAKDHKGRGPDHFHFRGLHPMFAGVDLDIAAVDEDGALNLMSGQSGHQGMQATAIWEETV
ncbi:MAG: MaoC family dehydratase N-terminal domain-containing protein [Paracoccaceae bacterium]